MRKIISSLLLMAVLVLCSAVAFAQGRVKVDGMATIHNNLIDIARDKAIDNAQRNAVEKVVGVMITSSTEVENFQLKLDRILSESKGFINDYKILSERREGDNYIVTLDADVGMGRLKDRLSAVNLIMTRKSKPRLMILFGDQLQKDAMAEAAMARYFLSQGFKLVNAETVRRGGGFQATADDRKEIARIAHRAGAEILIFGRVEVTPRSFKMGEVEVQSNEVAVSGKVINGDTGEVITTATKSAKGEVKVITEETTLELAMVIKEDILARWSSELANTVTVKVLVSGLETYQDLMRFKELLSLEVKGFKVLYQRSYSHGQGEFDIELEGNTQGLADDLVAMNLGGRKLKILEITQNRIEAGLLP